MSDQHASFCMDSTTGKWRSFHEDLKAPLARPASANRSWRDLSVHAVLTAERSQPPRSRTEIDHSWNRWTSLPLQLTHGSPRAKLPTVARPKALRLSLAPTPVTATIVVNGIVLAAVTVQLLVRPALAVAGHIIERVSINFVASGVIIRGAIGKHLTHHHPSSTATLTATTSSILAKRPRQYGVQEVWR